MSLVITFGSVCSGIEAATVAWAPLGWRPVWLSEIEPFPCAVLAHHYPEVPNLGNMLHIPQLLRNGDILPPDVFTGGTPCQAFSLAGLRNSLSDARGNLSLAFCKTADEIDIQRAANGLLPCVVVWENVPGVLSTHDNAFGSFLAGLAGEDEALVPEACPAAGKASKFWKWDQKSGQHTLSWPKSGCVIGPQRAVAWRTFDAQYFGLAQRRERVFVVASARNGFDPAAVLFEFKGVRRDSAPSRGAEQDAAAGTLRSSDGGCDINHARAGHLQPCAGTLTARYSDQSGQDLMNMQGGLQVMAFGGNNTSSPIDLATACRAHASPHLDFESETFLVQPALSVALRGRDGGGDKAHVLAPIAFDARQNCVSSMEVFGALSTSSPQAQAVAYTLDAAAGRSRGAGTPIGMLTPVCITGEVTHTLCAEGFDASEDGTGRGQPIVNAFQSSQSGVRLSDTHATLDANNGPRRHNGVLVGMAVRRLTPRECERLQGFPDDYTRIPSWKGWRALDSSEDPMRLAAQGFQVRQNKKTGKWRVQDVDGPRYKAIGNSWAVQNVRWLGRRIDRRLRDLDLNRKKGLTDAR